MNGLYFYKLVSPHSEDVTKNCRLTVNEIDSNFLNLKEEDIKAVGFDCEAKVLTLTRNNGETLQADMSCAWQGLTSKFDVTFGEDSGCTGSGALKFTWTENGETYESTINGLVTKDNIGNYVMTDVTTDGTIIGNGRDGNPLSLNPIEQTGHYRPVIDLIDMTNGESLPTNNEMGDRYLTYERINTYGNLYNIDGVKEIEKKLSHGWRIPTKKDWDDMLNAIEPCAYRNHQSHDCHIELGKIAGKELKSAKKWAFNPATSGVTDETDYLFNEVVPSEKPINTKGINSYGFSALPAGFGYDKGEQVQKFGSYASFWTNTQTMPSMRSDYYVKTLTFDKVGVWQSADCPYDYRSLRLVKDYDGSNARESAYIGGKYYQEVLMPSMDAPHGLAIWTKTNIDINVSDQNQIKFNDTYDTDSQSTFVINEWNGKDWERKVMPDGGAVVINNRQCRTLNGKLFEHSADTEFRLVNGELKANDELVLAKVWEKIGAVILDITNKISSEKTERIEGDERLNNAINIEREERISADNNLSLQLSGEKSLRELGDNTLSGAISTEIENRIESEKLLNSAISGLSEIVSTEIKDRTESDVNINNSLTEISGAVNTFRTNIVEEINKAIKSGSAVSEAINAEKERASAEEKRIEGLIHKGGKHIISVSNGVVIPSYDGNEEHNITLNFDGDFGTF